MDSASILQFRTQCKFDIRLILYYNKLPFVSGQYIGRSIARFNSHKEVALTEEKRGNARAPHRKSRKGRAGITALKVVGTLFAIGVVTALMFFGIFMKYVHTTLEPLLDVDMSAYTLNQSSIVYYRDKSTGEWKELTKFHGAEDRTNIEYADIPDHVWQALVSIEDQRFFQHHGVDWKSTGKAVFTLLTGGGTQRGGSTITQQVIKNATGNNQPTIKRKVLEIFQALRFYKNYSPEETLTFYLNLVYFGNRSYGIQAAAENYFGKDAKDLTVAEGAAIVGITQYPYLYDPSRQGTLDSGKTFREKNKERQVTVLDKMHELGYLNDAEYEEAVNEPLVFVWDKDYAAADGGEETEAAGMAAETYDPYLIEQVFLDVADALHEEKGYSLEVAKKLLYTGGYQIYTTVDPEMQDLVERIYADTENLPYTSAKGEQLQSGMTIIDNATGNVVAMAGRIGERTGRFLLNYATNSRPCGSAIKPLAVYAPALETGIITPASVIDDYPVRLQAGANGTEKPWPKNSYTGYKGLITLQTALRVSTNTTAVRVLEMLSPSVSYEFMLQNLGFTTLVNDDLNSAALALGGLTYGVNTVEMAAAYSAFANNGVYTRPRTFVEVRDLNGSIVLENKQESWVAMKESTAYSVNELLKGVVRSGTGTGAAFSGMTIAGKTGTTSNNYDRYFVGYTPYYTAAVWIGYDRPSRIKANGNPAATLWKMAMSEIHETLPNRDFSGVPAEMTKVTVCTRTGLLQGSLCPEVQTVWVAASSAPTLICDGHVHISLCTQSGKLAGEYCPAECVEVRNAVDFTGENVAAGWGYERSVMLVPLSGAERDAYAARQAEDPNFVIPEGTPVTADDSLNVLNDLMMLGTCDIHSYVEPEPEPEQGYYDEFGNWISGETTEPEEPPEDGDGERNRDFLNWLLNAAA